VESNIYPVRDVFTPTKPARLAFVERDPTINDRLVAALRTPGKQLVVYGHSGSGKTTLLANKLHQLYEQHVTSRCVTGTSFDQLVADGFDQLGVYYEAERAQSRSLTLGAGLKTEYAGIKGQLSAKRESTSNVTSRLVLPPQLTPQTLARFLGEARCCWVLEDFHKIDAGEKKRLAQVMKFFMDMADQYADLRIVAIGAVDTARQVVEYDPEMRNRVAEIHVPLMSEAEVRSIILNGQKLLNISIPSDASRGIVRYSNGLASVCHQLCLNICDASGIVETAREEVQVKATALSDAVKQYLAEASDTLKSAFDKALRIKKKGRYDNTRLILQALVDAKEEGATHNQLLSAIHKSEQEYPASNLSHFLKQLQLVERGALVAYDVASGRYSFADPIYRAFATAMLKKVSFFRLSIDTKDPIALSTWNLHFQTLIKEATATLNTVLLLPDVHSPGDKPHDDKDKLSGTNP
jgi:GTPase SAR1 family protein